MSSSASTPTRIVLTLDDIVRDLKHLPSAPKVLPKLKRLLRDGNSSMREIVNLIRFDPGIAARVLQMGNSAYFNSGAACATMDEAVNRVGYDQIYELIAYAVSSQVLVRPLEVYRIEADEMWRLSVSCALAAEAIAARAGLDRSLAYTVGLLHNVGMVAIDEWALRNARQLRVRSTGLPREALEDERAIFGFTQAEIGAALLSEWEFSAVVSEPVRWQYTPRTTASHLKMASLLFAAKWVRSAVCSANDVKSPPPDVSLLQSLGLTTHVLAGIASEVGVRLKEVSSLLDSADTESPGVNCRWR